MKPITIIGGMGPQASSHLYDLIIDHSSRHPNHVDGVFPHVILRSIAIKDFISDKSRQEQGRQVLIAAAKDAAKDNPCAVTMACNTAHIFASDVAGVCGAPYLSMIDAVTDEVVLNNIRKVGLLSSPTTVRTQLYADALSARGVECLVPNTEEQAEVEKVIRNVISGRPGPSNAEQLTKIAKKLILRGAEGIILGCTELPLIFQKDSVAHPVFDSLEIMSHKLIDKYYE